MRKSFDYLYTQTSQDSIDIDDVGDVCISVFNDIGKQWFLHIETSLGTSHIYCFGPFDVDRINYFNKGFNYNYSTIPYNEKKLSSMIDSFLNDPKKQISQAFIVNKEDAYNMLKEIDFNNMFTRM